MKYKYLKEIMKKMSLDAIISTSEQTRLWYAGISTSAGTMFIEGDTADLVIDGRYIEYATKNANSNVNVLLHAKNSLKEHAETKNYNRIGIEKEYMTIQGLDLLKEMYPNSVFVPISAAKLRIIKTEEEISKMKKACDIAIAALSRLEKDDIKDGVSEKDLSNKLEYYMRTLGATKGSFDSIVVSGERGALPHGDPSNKKVRNGELLTIDFGAYYEGYASDITRTFKVGEVTDEKLNDIYNVVTEAQRLGREAVKPGISTFEIDQICREYITEKGYGEYFVHSTGHGLGIDVHELPNVSFAAKTATILEPGMVITVEPGIYIEGIGGIRVEDDVLVTEKGNRVLSR